MYPYLYPNVNWIDETFKDRGVSNKYTIEFRGGGAKFRYYTMANLLTDKGFIKTPNANDGYSTQNMYSRANLRTNLDNRHYQIEVESSRYLVRISDSGGFG